MGKSKSQTLLVFEMYLCAASRYFEGLSDWVPVFTFTIYTVHDHCVLRGQNTQWPLFCLIKHSFTPTAWNCVTKQRSPLACVAAGTMCTSSVTSNNGTIFIQQPVSECICAREISHDFVNVKDHHWGPFVEHDSPSKCLIVENNFRLLSLEVICSHAQVLGALEGSYTFFGT